MTLENITPGSIKAAMKDANATAGDLHNVPLESIKVLEGFNVRTRNEEYHGRVRFIADSIKANGFNRNKALGGYVAVEDGKNIIYVTDGHTRLEAAILAASEGAAIQTLPVIIKPKGTNLEDLTVALHTDNTGTGLAPLELGTLAKRLVNFGWEVPKIAEKLGFTKPYIQDLLLLTEAPVAVRKMVESGKVSATLAVQEIKKAPEKAATKLKTALETAESKGKKKATKADTLPAKVKPAAKKTKKAAQAELPIGDEFDDKPTAPAEPQIPEAVQKELDELRTANQQLFDSGTEMFRQLEESRAIIAAHQPHPGPQPVGDAPVVTVNEAPALSVEGKAALIVAVIDKFRTDNKGRSLGDVEVQNDLAHAIIRALSPAPVVVTAKPAEEEL